MDAEKRKDIGFGVSFVSCLMLIVSVVVGAFYATDVFVRDFSVLAGRSPYGLGR